MLVIDVGKERTNLPKGGYNPLDDSANSDDKMSAEKFDNLAAALTFAATVVTITLGFLFNL